MSNKAIDMEVVCEAVHKAYCDERVKQGREPYWTGGDYSKLDELTKDYDRATVRVVLKALAELEAEPCEDVAEDMFCTGFAYGKRCGDKGVWAGKISYKKLKTTWLRAKSLYTRLEGVFYYGG